MEAKESQKRNFSVKDHLSQKSKKVKTERKGYYMPTGLIPNLGNEEIAKALENRWGLTVNTGWLTVKDVGDQQEYDQNKFLNIGVTSDRITDEDTQLRIKVALPIPNSFPVDALSVGNRIRSKKCKVFNKGKGFATISIIDSTFVVDTAHENYKPFQCNMQDNN